MHYQSDFLIGSHGIVDAPGSVLHIWVCIIGTYLLIITQRRHTSLVLLWAVYFSAHTLPDDPSHHNDHYCNTLILYVLINVSAVWEGGSNVPCNCDWVLVVLSDTGLCVGACSCLRSRTCLCYYHSLINPITTNSKSHTSCVHATLSLPIGHKL